MEKKLEAARQVLLNAGFSAFETDRLLSQALSAIHTLQAASDRVSELTHQRVFTWSGQQIAVDTQDPEGPTPDLKTESTGKWRGIPGNWRASCPEGKPQTTGKIPNYQDNIREAKARCAHTLAILDGMSQRAKKKLFAKTMPVPQNFASIVAKYRNS